METGSRVLDALMITLPMMKKVLNLDMQICLCDREKTLAVWAGDTFKMDIKVGEYFDRAKPGHDKMLEAMETGKGNSGQLPAFVYGVPVKGIVTPVWENGKVAGVISCAISIVQQVEIETAAGNLDKNLVHAQISSGEIAEVAAGIADKMDKMKGHSVNIHDLVQSTADIVKRIQNNSTRSNILALNASIEGARAGEKGRGFTVVAGEMGKLAKMSGESTGAIRDKMQSIFEQLSRMGEEITAVANISIQQAANVEEITSMLQQIGNDANKLAKVARVGEPDAVY